MSHSGNGRHGAWATQNISTFSRCAQAYGHDQAWKVFVGVDFSKLPPVPDVIHEEREAARRTLWAAKKANETRYGRLDRKLSKSYKRGLCTLNEYYRTFDALWADTQKISQAADEDYATRIAEIDAKAAEQAMQSAGEVTA